MIFGWTTCLTYETGNRKLGYDYFSCLLDEMKQNGMQRLIVMLENSHFPILDPYNDGLAWPVRNPKLKSQMDPNAINADESTEFFSKLIEKAKKLGIETYIEVKYMGMRIGMREIEKEYPGIEFIQHDGTEMLGLCCDNNQSHNYMRDKIEDVVRRYRYIDGIALEHPVYGGIGCYCPSSQKKFLLDTGKIIFDASEKEIVEWQNERIKLVVLDLKKIVKSIRNEIKFVIYTGFSPEDRNIEKHQDQRGHSIQTLKNIGLDFVMPYCEGKHKQEESKEMERVIEYLKPLKVYIHTTIRKNPPRGYSDVPKDPKYIKDIIAWANQYSNKESRLIGMSFFNEVNIPQENRDAVYENRR